MVVAQGLTIHPMGPAQCMISTRVSTLGECKLGLTVKESTPHTLDHLLGEQQVKAATKVPLKEGIIETPFESRRWQYPIAATALFRACCMLFIAVSGDLIFSLVSMERSFSIN